MQMHDPKEVVHTYLLDPSNLGDDDIVPHSIHILREYLVDALLYLIVTYTTQLQEQRYACMQVTKTGTNSWKFSGFQMMGGHWVTNSPQEMPHQIAWTRSYWTNGSSCAIVVLPTEKKVANICLRVGAEVICDEQLENNTMFFFTDRQLREKLHVELYDYAQTLIAQYFI